MFYEGFKTDNLNAIESFHITAMLVFQTNPVGVKLFSYVHLR